MSIEQSLALLATAVNTMAAAIERLAVSSAAQTIVVNNPPEKPAETTKTGAAGKPATGAAGKPVADKPKTEATVTPIKPQEKPVEQAQAQPAAAGPDERIEALRKRSIALWAKHAAEIKAWLSDKGAARVAELDAQHLPAFDAKLAELEKAGAGGGEVAV